MSSQCTVRLRTIDTWRLSNDALIVRSDLRTSRVVFRRVNGGVVGAGTLAAHCNQTEAVSHIKDGM